MKIEINNDVKMNISKEKFVYYVTKICEIYDKAIKLDNTLEKELDCTTDMFVNLSNVQLMAQMLDDWCGYEDEWVEWYVFESGGGHADCICGIGNDDYTISTPEGLYQYLTLLYNEG